MLSYFFGTMCPRWNSNRDPQSPPWFYRLLLTGILHHAQPDVCILKSVSRHKFCLYFQKWHQKSLDQTISGWEKRTACQCWHAGEDNTKTWWQSRHYMWLQRDKLSKQRVTQAGHNHCGLGFWFLVLRQTPVRPLVSQPKCPKSDKWIKKLWYINKMEYYSATSKDRLKSFVATWVELKGLMLPEISWEKRETLDSPTYMWDPEKSKGQEKVKMRKW